MQQIGFVGPSYTLPGFNVACQRSVNLFPEMTETGTGKNQEIASMARTPGLVRLGVAGSGPNRGSIACSNGRSFVVSGNGLYEITDPFAPILRGTIGTIAGRVGMAENGTHMIIVDGAAGWLFSLSGNVFTKITSVGFPNGATSAAFQDGYFIVNRPNTKQFFVSNLYAGMEWNGLDTASKEGQPDNLVALISDHRELLLGGEKSSEVWFNDGQSTPPFARQSFVEKGVGAAGTLQKLDNSVFWVEKDAAGPGIVDRAGGAGPQRVSTFPIEQAIASYGDISKATAWTYQQNGHSFYVLNFPNASTTWVLDAATGLWHERQSTSLGGVQGRHRAENHIYTNGRHIVGDFENGNLYELSDTAYTDDGSPIALVRTTPHIASNGNWVYYSEIFIDMLTGVGLPLGQGVDPQIMLRFSDDGGHVWSSERSASFGRQGEFQTQAVFRRLGRSRSRVFEIKITDPVPVRLISSFPETQVGSN